MLDTQDPNGFDTLVRLCIAVEEVAYGFVEVTRAVAGRGEEGGLCLRGGRQR